MPEIKTVVNRRDFIKSVCLMSLLPGVLHAELSAKKTKVVLIRDKDVIDEKLRPNAAVILAMLDKAVAALVDEKEVKKAWKLLFKPDDIVGIKSNEWNLLRTPKELEEAIKVRLQETGVKEDNIAIDDRGVLRNPVFKKSTALINVRPLRTHYWSGIGGCLKNYIMFTETPSDYHSEYCSPLAKIWDFPQVKGKTKLNILVLLTPLFHGMGPHHYNAKYVWNYKGLLVGTDPVSLDAVGVHILKAKRYKFFGKEMPFNPPPIHVEAADKKYKLGVSDINKIDIVRLGWQEEILI
ncbi:MAG: hypothetical protein A2Y62_21890 [Candidatus Fischerbacteria bacterium RBG_13_37_8]|uniref:DUF362 domain-containing protein n=1 Tax=Candidatus Fischerbacteria bacterium RBG_13_37_8 TaxID=1817863 RepID=A0A1F5VTX8_9BACT|nr:MAG: hypothetical protein A2Y62_21890 [Candidatus Fischerbacteria bacterium RBG_13_37_8]